MQEIKKRFIIRVVIFLILISFILPNFSFAYSSDKECFLRNPLLFGKKIDSAEYGASNLFGPAVE